MEDDLQKTAHFMRGSEMQEARRAESTPEGQNVVVREHQYIQSLLKSGTGTGTGTGSGFSLVKSGSGSATQILKSRTGS